jgi:hypothetical protein
LSLLARSSYRLENALLSYRFLFSSGKASGRSLLETIDESCYSGSLSVRSFGFPLSLSDFSFFYLSLLPRVYIKRCNLAAARSAEISRRQVRGRTLARSSARIAVDPHAKSRMYIRVCTDSINSTCFVRRLTAAMEATKRARNGELVSPNRPVTRRFGDRSAELSDISKFPSKIRHIDRDGRSDGTRRRIDCCTLKLDNLPNRRGAILNSNFSAILI